MDWRNQHGLMWRANQFRGLYLHIILDGLVLRVTKVSGTTESKLVNEQWKW